MRLWHKCFPVKFAKCLRTALFREDLQWLLLNVILSLKTFYRNLIATPIFCSKKKKKFSINDFSNKYDQICIFLRIWLHLLKNFIFCVDISFLFGKHKSPCGVKFAEHEGYGNSNQGGNGG